MKAITLTQPYATLIALGAKRIETRPWQTSYCGPLAIHAGKGYGDLDSWKAVRDLCGTRPFFEALMPIVPDFNQYCDRDLIFERLPLGAIVAVCEVVDCVSTGLYSSVQHGAEIWQVPPGNMSRESRFGDYSPGRFAWLLTNIRALPEPIPAKGALGLWELNTATEAAVMGQLQPAARPEPARAGGRAESQ